MTERYVAHRTNQSGIDLIKRFEGYRGRAYRCAAGVWTIGWGSTRNVRPGMSITEDEAEQRLRADLVDAENAVAKFVTVPLNDNEFSALVSLVFNIGAGAFKTSTLRRYLNEGLRQQAADQFLRWNRAGGRVLEGLNRRRAAERALFLTPA